MTPKEKAIDLVEDMHDAPEMGYNEHARQCALIAVDEILNLSKIASLRRNEVYMELEYWIEVKQEIEKL